jgi:hypothetical protein
MSKGEKLGAPAMAWWALRAGSIRYSIRLAHILACDMQQVASSPAFALLHQSRQATDHLLQ